MSLHELRSYHRLVGRSSAPIPTVQLHYFHGTVRLGVPPFTCDLPGPLAYDQSEYVQRRMRYDFVPEARRLRYDFDEEEPPQIIIEVRDCPGDMKVWRVVQHYMYYSTLRVDLISVSNIEKVFAAFSFLDMEVFIEDVEEYLSENICPSWENCLRVLATFNFTVPQNEYKWELFTMLTEALYTGMEQELGLTLSPSSSLCSTDMYPHIQWVEPLRAVLPGDPVRRCKLLMKLAQSLIKENPTDYTEEYSTCIPGAFVVLPFISALLAEAIQYKATLRSMTSDLRPQSLEATITCMQNFVSIAVARNGLRIRPLSNPLVDGEYGIWRFDDIVDSFKKFDFETLRAIAKNVGRHSLCLGDGPQPSIVEVAKIMDTCIKDRLRTILGCTCLGLTIRQALQIYEVFPNDRRSSYDDIVYLFAEALEKKAVSTVDIDLLLKVLDFQKLSAHILKRLVEIAALGQE